ncbi:hypothetical protein M0R45_037862 [Rubus argutus]|uniref:AAA+ ATPase domain-containing protein n=1 Tax=Rubus argutus TaxID=59490 RepID=A0AAW1W0H1_RUBAR
MSTLSTYASFAATVMFGRSIAEQIIPKQIRKYIFSFLMSSFFSSQLTFVVEEYTEVGERNQIYECVELYLRDKIGPETRSVRLSKTPKQKTTGFSLDDDQEVTDTFENFNVKWRYVCIEPKDGQSAEKRYYQLIFHKKHRGKVIDSYLANVYARAKDIKSGEKVLKIFTRSQHSHKFWESTILDHPSTFETLAMEPAEKKAIMDDLDLFVQRKEFYKKVGKAWKRGYLLYGPPGTGKSSLIGAMANYLQYNIYDLELTSISNNTELRKALLSTSNRSILVIEDIDCSLEIQNREADDEESDEDSSSSKKKTKQQQTVTLSGLLNFIDGLWSSCGDQRIIVFTTNYKDKLDPALLRPGRMDMHINMSYCTASGFKILASNYLGIQDSSPHPLYGEIEGLIESMEVTPAQVAGELQVSNDAHVALKGLLDFLKDLKKENDDKKKEAEKTKKLTKKRLLSLFRKKKEIT